MDLEDVSPPGWLRSHPTLAVVVFAALVALALLLCQFTGFVARPRPPASPTQTPSAVAVAPTGSRTPAAPPLVKTPAAVEALKTPAYGAPVAFVAWGSYRTFATYVAPTRPPGDPRFPAGSRYPLGINVLAYMSSAEGGVDPLWDVAPVGCSDERCSKSNINWTPLDRAIATVSAYTVTLGSGAVIPAPVTLNLPPMMLDREPDISCGSAEDPCIRAYVPAWMEPFRKTFQNVVGGSNWWYNTVNYGDPIFRARIKQFLTEAAARYDLDARVTAIRVDTGFQGETQPVKKDKLDAGTEDDLIASHEKVIPCTVYQSYVREIAEHAYAVFKHKPVYLMPGPAPCAGQSGQRWRYDLLFAPEIGWEVVTPKKMIGFSLNNDNPDLNIAGEQPGNPYADYRWWAIGPKLYSLNRPVTYETGANPTDALVDGDPWAFMVWRAYAVAGAKGDFFMSNSSWWRYATPLFWDVIDNWMARRPQRLWIVFRNSEWTTYNWTEERGASGYLGVWGNWLDLQGRDGFKQACNQTLYQNARSEVITLKATPSLDIFREPCDQVLPAPAITPMPVAQDGPDLLNRTFNRQALVLDATGPSSEMHVALATDHPAYGLQSPLTVTVSYLDRGTDRFSLTFPAADGTPVRLTVVKSGTNIWQQQTFRVKAARLENRLSSVEGPVFLIISNDSNSQPEYLHEVYADIDWPSLEAILNGERLAPLPSPSATLTRAPTSTATATAGVTPSQTPSVTPRPSATATPTPTASASASATTFPTGTASPTGTATPSPTTSVTPRSSAIATPTARASATASPMGTASPTGTVPPTRTATPSQTPGASVTPTKGVSRTPTLTPGPTATTKLTLTSTVAPTATRTAALAALACMPKVETITYVGDAPKAIAASADGFFAGLYTGNRLIRFAADDASSLWQAETSPGSINGVAVWGQVAMITNRDRGTVTLHDTASGAQLAVLQVGKLPWGVAAAEGLAYVANFADGTVSVIDITGRRVQQTTQVAANPVTVVAAGRDAYVVHLDGRVVRLDAAGQVVAQAAANAPDARGIAWDRLRNRLYVGSGEGWIAVLDATTLQTVGRLALPGPAYGLALNPGTGRIYAVDATRDRLYVVEPDGKGFGEIALPEDDAQNGGMGIAVWNNRVAVASYAAGSVMFVADTACVDRITPSPLPPTATAIPTALMTPTPSASASATASPTGTAMPLPPLPPTFMPLPVVTRTATPTATPSPTPTLTATPTATASPTVTHTVTATITPSPTATRTSTAMPSATPSFTPTATLAPTPSLIRAKIEIVWPHGGASVQDADLANLAVYLLEPGGGSGGLLQPPACGWTPVVRLWVALNAQPARPVAVGQKRMVTESGRTFPVWDFNDVDVSLARDPSNKLSFFATVDGVRTLHNVWVHAADARTIFPQPDMPTGVISRLPTAVDARIEIVWPHNSLPTDQANLANVTAYLFSANGTQAISPDASWRPTARLHWALNNDTEAPPDVGLLGSPRTVTGANGVKFLAYDFNDVDVSAARDPLNRIYFWVSTDELVAFPNVWAHATDARTIFAQPDTLNSCR